MAQTRKSVPGKTGPELFEWIAVTLILTLAFFVLFQAVGPQLSSFFAAAQQLLMRLLRLG